MFVVRAYHRPSPSHGIGVFAEEPIKQGRLVWKFDTRPDMCIPVAGQSVMTLCTGNSQNVNQPSYPKLLGGGDGLQELAAWEIAAGGGLTCNFYKSDLAADEKLGSNP